MKQQWAIIFTVITVLVLATACGGGGTSDGDVSPDGDTLADGDTQTDGDQVNLVCAPGDVKECPCVGGSRGVQTCADDGSKWGACEGCTAIDGDYTIDGDNAPDGDDIPDGDLPMDGDVSSSDGDEREADQDVEEDHDTDAVCICSSGPCCDGCSYFGSDHACETDADFKYGCPNGTTCGEDVGIRYRDRMCSGNGTACDGSLGAWKSWGTADACWASEYCSPGIATCQSADSQDSYTCDSGDVYWYDSCMVREDIKEECDNCVCSENTCVANDQYSSQCYDDDVYWYDCHGVRKTKKAECGAAGCSGGRCHSDLLSCTNGICTGQATGFEWQQEPTGGPLQWGPAKTHCQNLTLDGGGWRLPNISELRSLIRNCADIETGGACGVNDECSACGVSSGDVCLESSCWKSSVCDPDSCSNDGGPTGCNWPEELSGTCSYYWSSSPVEDDDCPAWRVFFLNGNVNDDAGVAYFSHVRCVR